ncbi:LppU/SCO3897 family protein [Dactylosporangium sp. CS-033363]|uniref:LppU/SCO3897 family protein n=1 Tax=Dactylosporangium sp. CS-033363 TaxID=3239935 RepID=UPI003D924626
MSDQYPPPGSYPPPGGGGYPPPGGDQPPYGQQPSSGGPYGQQPSSGGPYGQPASGAPYGQQPSSGAPYDPAYGQPPASGSPYDQPPAYGAPAAPGAPFGAPPPPPKKSSAGKIILIILGVILVLALVCCGGIFLFARSTWNDIVDSVNSDPSNAAVGDCLAGDSIGDNTSKNVSVKIVKCDDATAKYKVVGIKNGVSQTEALKDEATVCDSFSDAKYVLWQGTNEASGDALCLDDAK